MSRIILSPTVGRDYSILMCIENFLSCFTYFMITNYHVSVKSSKVTSQNIEIIWTASSCSHGAIASSLFFYRSLPIPSAAVSVFPALFQFLGGEGPRFGRSCMHLAALYTERRKRFLQMMWYSEIWVKCDMLIVNIRILTINISHMNQISPYISAKI